MNKKAKHKVLAVRHLTPITYVLQVERADFEFIPGQCVNIGLSNSGINREYSTYSSLTDENKMEFLIRAVENGKVSTALRELKPGSAVQLDGAYGKFTLKNLQNTKQKYIFIASGTGIAPFHSFALSYPDLDYTVLHGIRFAEERYDFKDYKKGRYIACISKTQGIKKSKNPPVGEANQNNVFSGRVTDYLRNNKVDQKAIYYLCGNTEMINEVYDILRENGVNGDNIFTEVFF